MVGPDCALVQRTTGSRSPALHPFAEAREVAWRLRKRSDLPPVAQHVLLAAFLLRGTDGTAIASVHGIAAFTGLDRRTVSKYLRALPPDIGRADIPAPGPEKARRPTRVYFDRPAEVTPAREHRAQLPPKRGRGRTRALPGQLELFPQLEWGEWEASLSELRALGLLEQLEPVQLEPHQVEQLEPSTPTVAIATVPEQLEPHQVEQLEPAQLEPGPGSVSVEGSGIGGVTLRGSPETPTTPGRGMAPLSSLLPGLLEQLAGQVHGMRQSPDAPAGLIGSPDAPREAHPMRPKGGGGGKSPSPPFRAPPTARRTPEARAARAVSAPLPEPLAHPVPRAPEPPPQPIVHGPTEGRALARAALAQLEALRALRRRPGG